MKRSASTICVGYAEAARICATSASGYNAIGATNCCSCSGVRLADCGWACSEGGACSGEADCSGGGACPGGGACSCDWSCKTSGAACNQLAPSDNARIIATAPIVIVSNTFNLTVTSNSGPNDFFENLCFNYFPFNSDAVRSTELRQSFLSSIYRASGATHPEQDPGTKRAVSGSKLCRRNTRY
jgi:hypothetical protein